MKKLFLLTLVLHLSLVAFKSQAQSWNTTGNAATTPGTNFIGTTDNKDFVFKTFNTEKGRLKSNGLWQFGATSNLAKIDSGGNLSFSGTAAYKVAGNKYAFQYAGNPNYGLFFNSTSLLYEFRTSTALSVFSIGANSGNGIFKGNLKIGAYTLPATDGTTGQVLQTNGTGTVTWQTVSGGANTSLSNLGVTAINTNLLPGFTLTYDLGSTAKVWRDVYTSGAIYHNSIKILQCPSTDNCFVGSNTGSINTGSNNTFVGGFAGYNNTSGSGNSFIGSGSGSFNNAGNQNTFMGTQAGGSNTSGSDNTMIGFSAGSISNGSQNCFYGSEAADFNSSGSYNSFYGYHAGYGNGIGSYNCFFGLSAGQNNTSANYNSFFGINAGYNTSTGGANTFIGETTGFANQTGTGNTFLGSSAGRIATSDNNTFLGAGAGRFTTTGLENSFTGYQSGYTNADGGWNVFNGAYSGYANSSGSDNTFMGKNSGINNTFGNDNVMIGFSSGSGNTTGSDNVFIGHLAHGSTSGITNSVAIGANAIVSSNNAIVLGANGISVGINTTNPTNVLDVFSSPATGGTVINAVSSVSSGNGAVLSCSNGTSAYGVWGVSSTGYAGYFSGNVTVTGVFNNPSDAKLKENIQPMVNALDKILLLNASTYTFKPEYDKMNLPKGTQNGFIAQEVEKVFPELVTINYDKSMDEKNPMEYKGINYIGMIPVLAEAIKEQQKEIETVKVSEQTQTQSQISDLQNENAELKNELAEMKQTMNDFQSALSQCCTNYQPSSGSHSSPLDMPKLEQNVPNPFSQNTIINYYLPQLAGAAVVKVYSLDGTELKSFAISKTGFGQIAISGNSLPSGVYVYTLIIDGKSIDTKQMILTKN